VTILAALLLSVLALAPAAASAARGFPAARAAAAPPASVLAKLAGPYSTRRARALAARHGLRVLRHHRTIGWVELALPRARGRALAAASRSVEAALARAAEVVGTDGPRPGERLRPAYEPRDAMWTITSSIVNPDTGSEIAQPAWHLRLTNFPAAWDVSRGSAQAAVAVIDTEFWTEHPDLKDKLLPGINLSPLDTPFGAYRTPNVRAQASSERFHGTHVAGIVGAATDNVVGVSAAGFGTPVIPIKVSFASPSAVGDITEAITYATSRGPVVINMSFGGTAFHPAWQDALARARAAGILPVASAANDQLQRPGFTFYPAGMAGVLAVGATTPSDNLAYFSSTGDFVDVSAPGDPILSTWDPRIASNYATGYHVTGGTSMAAPMVAGLAALIKARRPELTPDEVEALITGTALDRGLPGKDQNYGTGRIDAARALAAAVAYQRPAPPPPPVAAPAPRPTPAPRSTRRIALRVSAQRVRRGSSLRVSGRLPGVRARAVVRVQVRRFGGGRFRTVRRVRTRSNGRFAVRVRFARRGPYELRVLAPGLRSRTAAIRVR